MPLPLVSVVIASHQHAAFVARAVESVLAQTLREIEVIVVDDASSDGTPDIVAAIADPRLRLVRLAENRRQHARNLGLGLARGRYVAFQNSDDEWLTQKLARQVAELESRAEIGACFTAVELIDDAGRAAHGTWLDGMYADGRRAFGGSEWLRLFFMQNPLCVVSAVVRRELVERVGGFRHSLLQLSDLDLWIRLAAQAELHVVPEPLTRMRVGGRRNLSAPSPESDSRAMMEMVDVLENYVRPPLLARLHEIFPGAALPPAEADALRLARFARFAAERGGVPHRIFADRLLARLIDDTASREAMLAAFGADVLKYFWANRSRLAGTGAASGE